MNHADTHPAASKPSWRKALATYGQWSMLRMLCLGFGAGLPFLLVFGTLSFWLRESGVNRATIGFMSWIGLMYGFKWVWAPLLDRVQLPILSKPLGNRRAWLLLAQFGVCAGLLAMGFSNPKAQLMGLVFWAVWVAFFSATQDIALDAYRIESADNAEQAALAACYQTGYRLAMIWAGAGALWLAAVGEAQQLPAPWLLAYGVMAASMSMAVVAVLFSPNTPDTAAKPTPAASIQSQPSVAARLQAWFEEALIHPFKHFLQRFGWREASVILALVACYRISDVVMGVMANTFYVDMGYSKTDVAQLSKLYGVVMALLGAGLGGLLVMRFGLMRILFIGALLSAATNLLFAGLHQLGRPDYWGLAAVISADNLAGGIASAAFVAYLSSLTQRGYTATQYALLTSLMVLLPKYLAGFSGVVVNAFDYSSFFIMTAALGIPVCILVSIAARLEKNRLRG